MVEAGRARGFPVLRLAVAGERHQHRRAGRGRRPQAPRQFISIDLRQPDVEDDDVGPCSGVYLEALLRMLERICTSRVRSLSTHGPQSGTERAQCRLLAAISACDCSTASAATLPRSSISL